MLSLIPLIFLSRLFPYVLSDIRTSQNACTNEKSIFKFDIRQRFMQLEDGSTIEDLDAQAICQEAYLYDFIWLYQLWTPSKYNYVMVNGKPQQTNDYRELENIKEYIIDPFLGSLTNLYKFQSNIKKYCPHMQFLGEFSFYVPKDSYLVQNRSRFFQKPLYSNPNIYTSRYDDDNFLWAINDQMKTVPYALPWNYFTQDGINDMLDIIYRVIITQHRLDGVVFLQPSLGLYTNFVNLWYSEEIADQATLLPLTGFYDQVGMGMPNTDKFFVGGPDSQGFKYFLINYLRQVIGQSTINNWANINFTFSETDKSSQNSNIDPKTIRLGNYAYTAACNMDQYISVIQNNCMRYNISGSIEGVGINSNGFYLFTNGGKYGPGDGGASPLTYGNQDIIETQYEPQTSLLRCSKFLPESPKQTSMFISYSNQNVIKFTVKMKGKYNYLNIAFPFLYVQKLKSSNLVIQGQRHLSQTQSFSQQYQYIAQVYPSINQIDTTFTLNFLIVNYIEANCLLGVGVCNKDVLILKNHQHHGDDLGYGVYMLFSNGGKKQALFQIIELQHNSSNTINSNNIEPQFGKGNLVSITYVKSNNSITYHKDQLYLYSLPIIDIVKNLHFCVATNAQYTTVSLEY